MLIIGDVHGCIKTLKALLRKTPEDEVCFVGDLIDKGPASREVVAFVRENGFYSCRGNHEDMLMKFIAGGDKTWLNSTNGGRKTLDEYGYSDIAEVRGKKAAIESLREEPDIQWMINLPIYLEFPHLRNRHGRYLFVTHSSVGKAWRYFDRMEQDQVYRDTFEGHAIWGRPKVVEDIPGVFNVFGHTPVAAAVLQEHYANLDSGCFIGNREAFGFGELTALRFPEMELYTQKYID